MYACLRDESSFVRSNTLTVLTHLILNDMIKVKGQISDMALLIVDDVEKISNMAKLFFTELARKGNALYNVMPDIISGLSNPEAGIEEDNFREVMKYIIALIEKVFVKFIPQFVCHFLNISLTYIDISFSSFLYRTNTWSLWLKSYVLGFVLPKPKDNGGIWPFAYLCSTTTIKVS